MKKSVHNNFSTIQQMLNIVWMLLTVIFLLLAMYYQWAHYQVEEQKQIQANANNIRVQVDNLIERALNAAYSLPLYGREFRGCQNDLLFQLRSISFNSPLISGLVISDSNNNVICSTLGKNYYLPSPATENLALFGPLKIDDIRQDAFLLQQKLGEYHLGIYIIKSIILNALKSVPPEVIFVGLYDGKQKKFVLANGAKPLSNNYDSTFLAEAPLQTVDLFKVILATNPEHFKKGFIYHILAATFIVLLASFLLYFRIRSLLNKRFSLNSTLNTAIKNNRFQPVYQPIMDCTQNKYCGAEILLRWQMDKNEIMPEAFIEEAEQSGLIVPMTLQVLKKALKEFHDFLKEHPEFHLALNISASHFNDRNFFIEFYRLCKHYKVKPQQIMLELTERELLDQNNKGLIAKMHELRDKGHSLAIDDFGTGHASIKYLQHFPFNYLKIDKIFIHAIGTGAITESLNQAIIHMGNSLKLEIIAEGVETKEQFMLLRQYQVRFMQGWFFEKAVPYEQLIRIIDGIKHE
ncbi:EAL domain-containing protein [Legionella cardiaca]|uniref:cyclic-guanylate-specific phosphodiesterase n=1 Tax=Legionella cardiaca TaxID=1071983 RepID=A0ABY8AYW5_9GAMM|nr:EAL domain-containing protein [Legionella cardiaca]WED44302.1 EAL domain-containing protein [Legionella cardiaca]